jgi:hypothetical protein
MSGLDSRKGLKLEIQNYRLDWRETHLCLRWDVQIPMLVYPDMLLRGSRCSRTRCYCTFYAIHGVKLADSALLVESSASTEHQEQCAGRGWRDQPIGVH